MARFIRVPEFRPRRVPHRPALISETAPIMLLEVIACSLEDALEAERGGAGRIELVRELARDGLTPSVDLIGEVLAAVRIPVRVMIREADGYLAGGGDDVERLVGLAARAAGLGVSGIVLGFLHGRSIDVPAMDAVLAAAAPVRATFHRAFEDLPDPVTALGALRRWPQIDRVLTSGGPGDWPRKAARIAGWSSVAMPGIAILAGGGVDVQALRILSASGVREAHVGRAARMPPTVDGAVSSQRVAALVEAAGG